MTRYKGKLIFTLDGKEMTFNEALQMEGFDANLLTISYKVMGSEDKNTRIGDLLDEIDKERQEAARPGVSNAFNMDPLTQGTVFDSRLWMSHMSAPSRAIRSDIRGQHKQQDITTSPIEELLLGIEKLIADYREKL
jgi:hypothetical protein